MQIDKTNCFQAHERLWRTLSIDQVHTAMTRERRLKKPLEAMTRRLVDKTDSGLRRSVDFEWV
jgi:predicted GIY-YIG superfamily endonuclease